MRDYGKVHSTFWSSPTTAGLSPSGKLLALYLMTCSHSTISGVFRLPDGYAAEDLGWDAETVREGFRELFDKGFATRCEATKWVWVTKHLQWNPPENPNQRKAAAKVASAVPDQCGWKQAFMRVCGPLLGLKADADPEPLPNPCETLSQPGTEAVTETGTEAGAGVAAAKAPAQPKAARLAADWHLPKAWGQWVVDDLGWQPETVRTEAAKFADYWHAKSGKDATKLDWEATWRNWCRNARTPTALGKPAPQSTADRDAEARRLLGFSNTSPELTDA